MTNLRLPELIGGQRVPLGAPPLVAAELYSRGIDSAHFLFPFIRRVWLDGVDITDLGIIWLSPRDDVALVLRTAADEAALAPEGILVTHERHGRLELELAHGAFAPHALEQVLAAYPEIEGHLRAA